MSSPGLRERKKQKTRWAIQEHAVRLFARQGYDATTIEQIAEAAEVSPSTVFRYFRTKEDIVVEDRYDELFVAALEAAPAGLSALGTMRWALGELFRTVDDAEWQHIRQRMQMTFSVPALRSRSLDNMLQTIDLFAPPLARRLGRPDDDYAVRVFAGAMLGGLIASVLEWAESEDGHLLELMLRALDVLPGLDVAPAASFEVAPDAGQRGAAARTVRVAPAAE